MNRTSGLRVRTPRESGAVATAAWTIVALGVVTILYVGADLLIPIALALLLAFVLSPLVSWAKKLKIPRPAAVALTVTLAFGVIFGLGAIVAGQVGQLAGDLPKYQSTMRAKVQSLRGLTFGSGTLERAADMLDSLGKELDAPRGGTLTRGGEAAKSPDAPIPVVIREPPRSSLQALRDIASPMLHPLATIGVIAIFVIFILLEREDLRNRLMSLAGARDIQRTTAAIDDAARRLSRVFLTQLALNACFGLVIGLGLWLIGVPSAGLWGIIAGVLRFVPYVGAVLAAIFPLALAAAVDPGWTMLIATAVLFAVVEPIVGHVVEPMIYGRTAGLSPVGVVVSATFWTALWGPIGLVLATPLTVCLVVLGRHVESFAFLDTMLGDRPALSPAQLFYQRMLAGDPEEASEKAQEFLTEKSLSSYYEEVALPGLLLAHHDAERGALSGERLAQVKASVAELVEDLDEFDDEEPQSGGEATDPEVIAALKKLDPTGEPIEQAPPRRNWTLARPRFMGGGEDAEEDEPAEAPPPIDHRAMVRVGGRTPIEQAAALIVAQTLAKNGVPARAVENEAQDHSAPVWCAVCLEPSEAHIRLAVRRIRRYRADAEVIVARWRTEGVTPAQTRPTSADRERSVQPDAITRSLKETVEICRAALERAEQAPPAGVAAFPA